MTTFLVDVSGAYSNLAGVKTAGAAGVISRCMTEPGTIDPAYAPTQAAAQAAGLLGGAYCFLTGDITGTTVEQRAERFIAAIGDPSELMIGLDIETPSYPALHPAPTASDVARWMAVWNAHYPAHPVLNYLPRWYWAGHMAGSPDLSAVGPLWASAYPGWTSFADYTSHAGDSNPEWSLAYAGYPRPTLWQFAGSVSVGGVKADLSAFRGTLAELRALALGGATVAANAPNPDPIHYRVNVKGGGTAYYDLASTQAAFTVAAAGLAGVVTYGTAARGDGKAMRVIAVQLTKGGPLIQVWVGDDLCSGLAAVGVPPAPFTQDDVNAAYLGGEKAGYDYAVNGVKVGSIQPPITFPPRPA